jgi:hypothetical protein
VCASPPELGWAASQEEFLLIQRADWVRRENVTKKEVGKYAGTPTVPPTSLSFSLFLPLFCPRGPVTQFPSCQTLLHSVAALPRLRHFREYFSRLGAGLLTLFIEEGKSPELQQFQPKLYSSMTVLMAHSCLHLLQGFSGGIPCPFWYLRLFLLFWFSFSSSLILPTFYLLGIYDFFGLPIPLV